MQISRKLVTYSFNVMAIESVITTEENNEFYNNVEASSGFQQDSLQKVSGEGRVCDVTQTSFLCAGCHQPITDQYVLRVAPDMEWHAECLRCTDCSRSLDESCTCFFREGRIYCKDDYMRLFGIKCAKCCQRFNRCDLVMRAKNLIYHVNCFRCAVCEHQLVLGEEYALKDGSIYCRAHHESDEPEEGRPGTGSICHEGDKGSVSPQSSPGRDQLIVNINDNNIKNGCVDSCSSTGSSSPIPLRGTASLSRDSRLGGGRGGTCASRHTSYRGFSGSGGRHHSHHGGKAGEQKTTRIRTVLNEKQLHTLRTCYSANSRPDALMKEQLVEMTGLSPRVIRVWFQNKRCKDKKRSIALKQLQQQQQNKMDGYLDDSWIGQKGIPLIATSPVRLEPTPELQSVVPVDVEKCPQPFWTPGQGHDDEEAGGGGVDAGDLESEAPFQQLINSFGDSFDDDSVVSFDDLSESSGRLSFSQHQLMEQRHQPPLHPLIHMDATVRISGLPGFPAGLTHLPGIGHITGQAFI